MALNIKPFYPLDHPEVTPVTLHFKVQRPSCEVGNRYSKENYTGPYEENEEHYILQNSPELQKKKLDII